MRTIKILLMTMVFFGCERVNSTDNEVSKSGFTIVKSPDTNAIYSPVNFNLGNQKYDIDITRYSKGDYTIADTVGKQITLYKPSFIDITINKGTRVTVDKNLFKDFYPDQKNFYHFVLGDISVDKIDMLSNKIIFKTLFGPRNSRSGQEFIYSIGHNGSFKFIELRDSLTGLK